MKKMILLMLLFVSVMGYSQAANVISVNFAERADQHVTAGEYAGISDYASANFNNFDAVSGSGPLVDDTGVAVSATITYSSSNNWGDGAAGFSTPDAKMSRGYRDDGDGGDGYGVKIQVTNVPYAVYSVVVYHSTGDNDVLTNGFAEVDVNGTIDRCVTGQRWNNVKKWIPGTNCIVFNGVTGSTLDIKVAARYANGAPAGRRGSVCGLQIYEDVKPNSPTPADGDTDVLVNSTVSWAGPTAYVNPEFKVYMGTDQTLVDANDISVLAATQTETTLVSPTPLYGATYFWKVVATDPNTGGTPVEHQSDVWSFTTEEHPSALELPGVYAPGITIGNPSFEKENTWSAPTSDWYDVGGAYQEPVVPTPYGTVLGTINAGSGNMHWQPIGTWYPDVDYLISWGVSKRPGYGDGGTKASLWNVAAANLANASDSITPAGIGATKIAETAAYTSGVDNQFVEVSEIVNTGTAGTAGDALIIKYENALGVGRAYFDMVRVELPRDPGSAWGPSPVHGAVDIDATSNLTLSWNQGVDPATNYQPDPSVTGYHIYFGTDRDAVGLADTTTAGIYQGFKPVGQEAIVIAAPFPDGVKLYWRVDEELNNGAETVTGPIWEMTTALSDRLIAHWKFEDSLNDEVKALTGDPEGDWPGDMTLPVYEAGIDGKGIRLYNDNQYITIPGSEDFFNFYNGGLTVNIWYLPDTYSGGWFNLISKRSGQNADGWVIFDMVATYAGGAQTKIDTGEKELYPTRSGRLDDGNWHMITITYNEVTQTMTSYLDGEVYGRAQGPVTEGNTQPIKIGGGIWGGEYAGLMDEVKIYSYALNEYEVAGIYTDDYSNFSTTKKICPFPDDPMLRYDFNGDCRVDIIDLGYIASNWLNCNIVPTCID